MTTHFIVNPASANGRTGRRWAALAAKLEAALGPFEAHLTQHPGHATDLARRALGAGAGRIVVVGGDGTVSEVVNGLLAAGAEVNPSVPLGLVAMGTGCDFARTAMLPRDLEGQISALRKMRIRRLDAGVVGYAGEGGVRGQRYFANVASFGLSARVAQEVNGARMPKRLGGPFAYALPALRALASHRNSLLRLSFDGNDFEELRGAFVVAAIGRYCGGGLMLAPHADAADGLLDVITVGDVGLWDGVTYIGRVYRGTHLSHPEISERRVRRLKAVAADPAVPVALEADGEFLGVLPAEIEIIPGALDVIVGDGET